MLSLSQYRRIQRNDAVEGFGQLITFGGKKDISVCGHQILAADDGQFRFSHECRGLTRRNN